MNKVKFDTRQEYEFVGNYKVLQHTFDKHKVDKIIPVDKLMKCKFQDNLEFMQWMKRYWDQNFPGGAYNAVARRKGGPKVASAGGRAPSAATRTATGGSRATSSAASGVRSTSRAAASSGRTSAGVDNRSASVIMELNKQIAELKLTVDGLEKERDFYFGKLRDIEILVQDQVEAVENDPNGNEDAEYPVLKEIQTILYSTEDGFEVPPENELEDGVYDEDETF
ncbi:unnamed protein product [Cunninghamella blakesleeana]